MAVFSTDSFIEQKFAASFLCLVTGCRDERHMGDVDISANSFNKL